MAKLLSNTRIYGTATVDTRLFINGGLSVHSTNSGVLQTLGGVGVWGGIFASGVVTATSFVGNVTGTASTATTSTQANNLNGGTAGQLVYQSAANTTAFAGPGTAGQILVSAGTSAPTYTNTSSIYVNRAVTADTTPSATAATNLSGGLLGQIPYQLAAGSTAFIGTGTAGTILQMGANTATFVATSTIYVNRAVLADNDVGGAAGGLRYQTAANASTFLSIGTAGQVLTVNSGATAPQWTTTGSIYAGAATSAVNLFGGAGGSLPYQSAANATTMLSIGSANSILVSNGTSPSWTTSPTIGGNVTIVGNLTVQGTTVIVDSTVTNISDPIFEIGTGPNGALPSSDDGKDRGIAFDWHNGTSARTGFFGFDRSTGYFTFISSASIVNEVVSPAGGTTRGALDVNLAGGTSGQLVYQSAANTTAFAGPGTAGQLLVSAGTSAPTYTNTSSIYVGFANQSNHLLGGAAGGIHYQTGAGASTFLAIGTAGQILRVNAGATAPEWISTSSLYSNSAVNAQTLFGGTAGQLVYQSGVGVTAFAGPGTAGQILISAGTSAPTYINTSSIYVGFSNQSNHLLGGAAGGIHYQTGAGASTFLSIGTAGQVLTVNAGATAPQWSTTSSFYAGFANQSNHLLGGTAGQLHYQTGSGASAFAGPGTAGQILVSAGTSAPTYTNTSSIYVNRAVLADNDVGGAAGGLRYQTAANASTFLSIGTAGQMLRVNSGATAPEWVGTSSIYVNRAVLADSATGNAGSATNLAGGTAGQVPYQTGAGATSFFGPGTAGQILVSAGTSAPTYTNTSSIYVNASVRADTVLTVARPNTGLHYLTFVDSHNASATAESLYTTSTINLDPRTGNVALGTTATSNKFEVAGSYGQLFSVADTFTGTIFAASDISGIPSIEVLDTGLVKLAQYNGQVTVNTATSISSSGLTAWTATWVRSIIVNQNGRIASLGVGTDASGTAGEIRATNEITAYYSDRRLKDNVKIIDNPIDKILSLHGITYTPNAVAAKFGYDQGKKLVGVFADEVEAVLPEAVRPAPFDTDTNGTSISGDNYKTVQYEKLVPLLIEAVKAQQKLIEKLEKDLQTLKQALK